jgi:predicted aminopeptidase
VSQWRDSFVRLAQADPERYREKFGTPQAAREFATVKAGLPKNQVNAFVRAIFPDLKKLKVKK